MKFNMRKFSILLVLLLMISLGFNIVTVFSEGVEPGSDQDPLVSKSYVDDIIAKNTAEVTQLKQQLAELKNQQQSGGSAGFVVLTVEAGQTLLPGSGTELILRSGKATGVEGSNGKLADVTSAKDLAKGTAAVINHLLISSRDDGRGLKASAQCYLLIRGAYKISGTQEAESSVDVAPQKGDDAQNNNTGTTGGNETSGNGTPGNETSKGKITASALNVRAEANTTAAIRAKAYKDEVISVLSTQGDWLKIKTAAGVEGWVLKQYVEMQ